MEPQAKYGNKQNDPVNHPAHYTRYTVEVIDMMVAIWGPEKVADYCEINAFKYRMRAGKKGEAAVDMEKEEWYLRKSKELRAKSKETEGNEGTGETKENLTMEDGKRYGFLIPKFSRYLDSRGIETFKGEIQLFKID